MQQWYGSVTALPLFAYKIGMVVLKSLNLNINWDFLSLS